MRSIFNGAHMIGLASALDGNHCLTLGITALQLAKLLFQPVTTVMQALPVYGQVGDLSELLIAQALKISQPLLCDNQRLPSLVCHRDLLMDLLLPTTFPSG
ncbi:hypothetical protein RT95_06935 [Xanthomonas campestris]|nr:hypothetical protein RT95_06935 [Xanthomonas campestris]